MGLLKRLFHQSTKEQDVSRIQDTDKLIARFGEVIDTLDQKELKIMAHVTTTLDRIQDQIDVVYDIGAFNGMWSKAFAIYTQGQVYSFRAEP